MQQTNQEFAFWCHICKKEFRVLEYHQQAMLCPRCNSEFCELIEDINNDPRKFIPYGQLQQRSLNTLNSNQSNTQTIISITSIQHNIPIERTIFDNLLSTLFPHSQFSQGHSLDQLIQYISENDPNRYGQIIELIDYSFLRSPPASKKSVEALKLIQEPKGNCSVCQESYQKAQFGVEMPCQHQFHQDCLMPWLQLHNSCPVCRFELPTDDEDYENYRKQRQSS